MVGGYPWLREKRCRYSRISLARSFMDVVSPSQRDPPARVPGTCGTLLHVRAVVKPPRPRPSKALGTVEGRRIRSVGDSSAAAIPRRLRRSRRGMNAIGVAHFAAESCECEPRRRNGPGLAVELD